MLNVFPGLLLPFLAPLLLRVAAALMFFYLAYLQWSKREAIAKTDHPRQVLQGSPVAWLAIIANVLIGISLTLGYYTQVAALMGALLSGPASLWKHDSSLFPFPRIAWLLLFIICVSLILSGAGAFAQDLPL